ncbi:MAG: cytochrome c oxidase subunit 2 [Planctomycetota bacterium]|nr:MAG: cytochrome c oxidase subunit 2 [Planctomycetota bacterium]
MPLAVDPITAFQLPEQGSSFAPHYDLLYAVLFWGSVFFFLVLIGPMIYFALRYRRRPGEPIRPTPPHLTHNALIEIAWIAVPLVLVVALFVVGTVQYIDASVAPANAYTIQVRGSMWSWGYTYPNGVESGVLKVPSDRPIKFLIGSKDTIHSFYVPAFRLKMDAVPNRYTTWWFQPTRQGRFPVYCAEFCGDQHSQMVSAIEVVSPEEFERWMAQKLKEMQEGIPLAELGRRIYTGELPRGAACLACHSLDGSRLVGPSFKGLWGRQERMQDGSTVTVDEEYIRESLMRPQARIVEGFGPVSAMQTYEGVLSDREVLGIIEFLKTVK